MSCLRLIIHFGEMRKIFFYFWKWFSLPQKKELSDIDKTVMSRSLSYKLFSVAMQWCLIFIILHSGTHWISSWVCGIILFVEFDCGYFGGGAHITIWNSSFLRVEAPSFWQTNSKPTQVKYVYYLLTRFTYGIWRSDVHTCVVLLLITKKLPAVHSGCCSTILQWHK